MRGTLFAVLIIRILLFLGYEIKGPLFSETPTLPRVMKRSLSPVTSGFQHLHARGAHSLGPGRLGFFCDFLAEIVVYPKP